jgi:Asp/Glu/hydantoin racemase
MRVRLDDGLTAREEELGMRLSRQKDGVCIACFRPPLVLNVREGPMVTFTFIDAEMTAVVIGS